MHAFFGYVQQCLDQQFYTKQHMLDNFSSLCQLFHLFVRQGFVTPENQTMLYYTFVLLLKDNLHRVGASNIIHVLWSLIAADDDVIPSPLLPRLFEQLAGFARDEPITKEEFLELHQVNAFAQEQVRQGKWVSPPF